ncbi:MAG: hypothetical protein ACI8XO_001482 [Verrucomicrobiales bacterium]|jgi:hypothetical protein
MKLFRRLVLLLALTATLAGMVGCAGYRLGSVKPSAFADIRSITIPTFKNDTQEPKIAVLVSNAVIGQMQTDGTYEISTIDKADAILKATITNIQKRALRGARTDVLKTREFEVTLVVEYTVEDLGTGSEIGSGSVSGRTNIFLDPNLQLTERQAIENAAEKLAITLTSRLTEGF